MADLTKALEGRTVTFAADSPRADPWMQQLYGGHTVTFDTTDPAHRERAIGLEAAALAMTPPFVIEEL